MVGVSSGPGVILVNWPEPTPPFLSSQYANSWVYGAGKFAVAPANSREVVMWPKPFSFGSKVIFAPKDDCVVIVGAGLGATKEGRMPPFSCKRHQMGHFEF